MTVEPYASARTVYWIVDNGSSHAGKTSIRRIEEAWPNARLIHLPVHASWVNQIELYFSIVQRKALTPNEFNSLDALAERLLAFADHYRQIARPFEWTFTRADLDRLLARIDAHEPELRLAADTELTDACTRSSRNATSAPALPARPGAWQSWPVKLGSRATVLASLAALVALATAAGGQSSGRVVGGTAVLVQSAPWAVYMRISNGSTGTYCSGSILDSLHVLTAAHCMYVPDGTLADPGAITVRTGISSSSRPLRSDAEQDRSVASFRVHPGFTGPTTGSSDDVAVLTLAAPLDLNGPAVQPIALPAPGAGFPSADTDVGFAGFGRESAALPATGTLNWLTGRVDEQGTCGGFTTAVIRDADAVSFCAFAPWSAVCSGDSGSGLVTSGPSRVLVGVVSAGQILGQVGCATGARTIFTAVWPPEILRFVEGDDQPPAAPRRTSATYVRLFWDHPLAAGGALVCFSDRWDGNPTITYAFLSARGRVLQQGPSSVFRLGARNAGDVLSCRASATNAGGTAVLSTDWVGTVAPASSAPPVRSKAARR